MRVVITADPYLPVPPTHYGGIERIIDLLVRGLSARGHDVTLIAHRESRTAARLVPYGYPPHAGLVPRAAELLQLGRRLLALAPFADVVHSFGRLGGLLPVLPLRRLAKVQSYQRGRIEPRGWRHIRAAARLGGASIRFVGCSASVYAERPADGGTWTRIFNGVDPRRYTFRAEVPGDAPLAFLGRIERIKGTHAAIAIARGARRRLVIAGNVTDQAYFDAEVAPHLDGDRVTYVGPVDDAQKDALLGGAAALLMPVEVEEAFGIVMAEALACGTPIIGFARGAVPEVIREGETGFVVGSVEQAVGAVARVVRLDRRRARADCEARFSAEVIVSEYERLYGEVLAAC